MCGHRWASSSNNKQQQQLRSSSSGSSSSSSKQATQAEDFQETRGMGEAPIIQFPRTSHRHAGRGLQRTHPWRSMNMSTTIAGYTRAGGTLADMARDSQRLHVTAELDWKRIE